MKITNEDLIKLIQDTLLQQNWPPPGLSYYDKKKLREQTIEYISQSLAPFLLTNPDFLEIRQHVLALLEIVKSCAAKQPDHKHSLVFDVNSIRQKAAPFLSELELKRLERKQWSAQLSEVLQHLHDQCFGFFQRDMSLLMICIAAIGADLESELITLLLMLNANITEKDKENITVLIFLLKDSPSFDKDHWAKLQAALNKAAFLSKSSCYDTWPNKNAEQPDNKLFLNNVFISKMRQALECDPTVPRRFAERMAQLTTEVLLMQVIGQSKLREILKNYYKKNCRLFGAGALNFAFFKQYLEDMIPQPPAGVPLQKWDYLYRQIVKEMISYIQKDLQKQGPPKPLFLVPQSLSLSAAPIGAGGFNMVFEANLRLSDGSIDGNSAIACRAHKGKFNYNELMSDEGLLAAIQRLKQPEIVQYYHVSGENDDQLDYLEYCQRGAIDDFPLDPDNLREYFYLLIHAVKTLHEKKIVHRDLKEKNILLGNDGLIKIIDFDASIFIANAKSRPFGTFGYLPPEFYRKQKINHNMAAAKAQDIWAIGVILYTLYTGQWPPYKLKTAGSLFNDAGEIHAFNNKNKHPAFYDNGADDFKDEHSRMLSKVIADLLETDSQEREKKFETILNHDYFKGVTLDSARRTLSANPFLSDMHQQLLEKVKEKRPGAAHIDQLSYLQKLQCYEEVLQACRSKEPCELAALSLEESCRIEHFVNKYIAKYKVEYGKRKCPEKNDLLAKYKDKITNYKKSQYKSAVALFEKEMLELQKAFEQTNIKTYVQAKLSEHKPYASFICESLKSADSPYSDIVLKPFRKKIKKDIPKILDIYAQHKDNLQKLDNAIMTYARQAFIARLPQDVEPALAAREVVANLIILKAADNNQNLFGLYDKLNKEIDDKVKNNPLAIFPKKYLSYSAWQQNQKFSIPAPAVNAAAGIASMPTPKAWRELTSVVQRRFFFSVKKRVAGLVELDQYIEQFHQTRAADDRIDILLRLIIACQAWLVAPDNILRRNKILNLWQTALKLLRWELSIKINLGIAAKDEALNITQPLRNQSVVQAENQSKDEKKKATYAGVFGAMLQRAVVFFMGKATSKVIKLNSEGRTDAQNVEPVKFVK